MTTGNPTVFLSYCHEDDKEMQPFKKHLQGMLHGFAVLRSDLDLFKGSEWHLPLRSSIEQASFGLILASPDYLISDFCRIELRRLAQRYEKRELLKLFWVHLKPCGWGSTELIDIQGFKPEPAISELPLLERDNVVVRICRDISTEIRRLSADKPLAFVRRLLADSKEGHDITVREVVWPPTSRSTTIYANGSATASPSTPASSNTCRPAACATPPNGDSPKNDFSIVCRGTYRSKDVLVKVLKWVPISAMGESLKKIGESRKKLPAPFVPLLTVVEGGEAGSGDDRLVFVSEYVPTIQNSKSEDDVRRDPQMRLGTLTHVISEHREKNEGKGFPAHAVIGFIRTIARALEQLHDKSAVGTPQEWETALGLLCPDDIFCGENLERPLLQSIGVKMFLWHVLGYPTLTHWIDTDYFGYMVPEQDRDDLRSPTTRSPITHQSDQYALARLAIELLEGKSITKILSCEAGNRTKMESIMLFHDEVQNDLGKGRQKSGEFIKGDWRGWHGQLSNVLQRMLAKKSEKRYPNMGEVVDALERLEEEERAYAKSFYKTDDGYLAEDKFIERFYDILCKSDEGDSKETKKRKDDIRGIFKKRFPKNMKAQHEKLKQAIPQILNFREGNPPTSIEHLIGLHRDLHLERAHFDLWKESFETAIPDDKGQLKEAWRKLLFPIIDYMKRECCAEDKKDAKDCDAGSATGTENHGTGARTSDRSRATGVGSSETKRRLAEAQKPARTRRRSRVEERPVPLGEGGSQPDPHNG